MDGRVHLIETFGTVDGPGVRLVVFLQGCPMRCLYCHNPDTWSIDGGEVMSVSQILEKYESYKSYYKSGGITVTGGEPLMQANFVIELFSKAKDLGIHTCLDTSGVTFNNNNLDIFNKIAAFTDLILLDIKHIDDESHTKITGYSNRNILDFAKYLSQNNIPTWVRHVVVPGITDSEADLYNLGLFIGELKNVKALDILPYHNMGKEKYENMGINYPLDGVPQLSKEGAAKARKVILSGIRSRRDRQ